VASSAPFTRSRRNDTDITVSRIRSKSQQIGVLSPDRGIDRALEVSYNQKIGAVPIEVE